MEIARAHARSHTHSAICLQIFNVDYDKSKRVNSDDYNGDHSESWGRWRKIPKEEERKEVAHSTNDRHSELNVINSTSIFA